MSLTKVAEIKNNPFRNFNLYPINVVQVAKLTASIESHSLWAGLPARKNEAGEVELVAGHHRLEACKAAGIEEIDLIFGEYSDDDMTQIMVKENFTQRGANFGAIIEAVAAVCKAEAEKIMAVDVKAMEMMEGEGVEAFNKRKTSVATSQKNITVGGRGIGREKVAQALDGAVTQYAANQAIKVLKLTGLYAKVLQDVKGVGAKALKPYKEAMDAKAAKAYPAIATFERANQGVAFMDAVVAGKVLTPKQYMALAQELQAKSEEVTDDAKGFNLNASTIKTAVSEKVGASSNGDSDGDNKVTEAEIQMQAEMVIRDLAGKLGEKLAIFMANYTVEKNQLQCDHTWADSLKKQLGTLGAYEDAQEEKEEEEEVNL